MNYLRTHNYVGKENNSVWMFISRKFCQVAGLMLFHTLFQKRECLWEGIRRSCSWWDAGPERSLGFKGLLTPQVLWASASVAIFEDQICIWSQENAVKPCELLFSPGTTERQKLLLASAPPHLFLLATFASCINPDKIRKISPYCSTMASWDFLKIQTHGFLLLDD